MAQANATFTSFRAVTALREKAPDGRRLFTRGAFQSSETRRALPAAHMDNAPLAYYETPFVNRFERQKY